MNRVYLIWGPWITFCCSSHSYTKIINWVWQETNFPFFTKREQDKPLRFRSRKSLSIVIIGCLKGNESLVEKFNFYFFYTTVSSQLQMLHFYANPSTIGLSGYRVMKNLTMLKNNIKQMNLTPVFANILKTISPTSDSFLLIMSHILFSFAGLWLDQERAHQLWL